MTSVGIRDGIFLTQGEVSKYYASKDEDVKKKDKTQAMCNGSI
jgi:hypothetical protein